MEDNVLSHPVIEKGFDHVEQNIEQSENAAANVIKNCVLPGMVDNVYFVKPERKRASQEGSNASDLVQPNHSKQNIILLR